MWSARCSETGHGGCGRRLGETHRWKHRQGAPGRPHYYLLEDQLEVWLINAEHLHNVPGRKTDVADSAWIAQMVEHGLVRPSFVPPPPIRVLRDLTRRRKTQVDMRAAETQRLEKVLQDAGIKLSSVATRVLGASGPAMLSMLFGRGHHRSGSSLRIWPRLAYARRSRN